MGGKGTIYGTIIGVLLLGSLEIGFVMIGIEVFYRYIAVGSILIFAVLVDQVFPDIIHNQ
jgi:ribose transport system permease protein